MSTQNDNRFLVVLYGGPRNGQETQVAELANVSIDGHVYCYTGKRVAPDGPYFFEHDHGCCDANDLHLGERPPLFDV